MSAPLSIGWHADPRDPGPSGQRNLGDCSVQVSASRLEIRLARKFWRRLRLRLLVCFESEHEQIYFPLPRWQNEGI